MSKDNVVRLRAASDDAELGREITVDVNTGEILDEDGDPTGRTLEDLTDEYTPPYLVRGSQQQMSLDIGAEGQAVVSSILKLKADKFPIVGQYKFGEKVRLTIEVEIEDVDFKAIRSSYTHEIVGMERIHTAFIEACKSD